MRSLPEDYSMLYDLLKTEYARPDESCLPDVGISRNAPNGELLMARLSVSSGRVTGKTGRGSADAGQRSAG